MYHLSMRERMAEAEARKVEGLAGAIVGDDVRASEAREAIHALIGGVTVQPDPAAPGGAWLEVEGGLAALLRFSAAEHEKPPWNGCSRGSTACGCGDRI